VKMSKIIKKPIIKKEFPKIEKIENKTPFIFGHFVSFKGLNTFRVKRIYPEYVKNGFEKFWDKHKELGNLAEVGLIHTEVAEAQESIRDNDYYNLGLELADIIIRVLNFCTRKGIPIEKRLYEKTLSNEKRKYKHDRNLI